MQLLEHVIELDGAPWEISAIDFLLEFGANGLQGASPQAAHLCECAIEKCGDRSIMCNCKRLDGSRRKSCGPPHCIGELPMSMEVLLAKVRLAVVVSDGADGVGKDAASAKDL